MAWANVVKLPGNASRSSSASINLHRPANRLAITLEVLPAGPPQPLQDGTSLVILRISTPRPPVRGRSSISAGRKILMKLVDHHGCVPLTDKGRKRLLPPFVKQELLFHLSICGSLARFSGCASHELCRAARIVACWGGLTLASPPCPAYVGIGGHVA